MNRSIYIRMHCVHKCVHSCTCTLCENSVRNNNPKSLQEVRRPCNNWIRMTMRRLTRAMAKGKASCREIHDVSAQERHAYYSLAHITVHVCVCGEGGVC